MYWDAVVCNQRFKSSEGVRVLVSANAVEEGIDVSDCEFVVRFNPIQTTKSHIQGSGRARLAGASCPCIS